MSSNASYKTAHLGPPGEWCDNPDCRSCAGWRAHRDLPPFNTVTGVPRPTSYPSSYGPGNGAADLRKAARLILHVKERLGAEWSTSADLLAQAAGEVFTVAEALERG